MTAFSASIEKALKNDNVVTHQEWKESVRAALKASIAAPNGPDVESGLQNLANDKTAVLMPEALAELRSLLQGSSLDALGDVISIHEDQAFIANYIEMGDRNKNGLDQAECCFVFDGSQLVVKNKRKRNEEKVCEKKENQLQGVHYLRVRLGMELDTIRGGASLYLAQRMVSGQYTYGESLAYFAAPLSAERPGLELNSGLVETYRAMKIKKPKPTRKSSRKGKNRGKGDGKGAGDGVKPGADKGKGKGSAPQSNPFGK